jgi:hypothetical protein
LVDTREIVAGGPPPDGIPPIDSPRFEKARSVGWLADDEPVIAVEVDGESRAYPVQILTWHEIVNDSFGTLPVTVTYCPLCNSAVAYERRVGDTILDFGTSGSLYRSALVMFDRQSESLWTHFTGQAVTGHLAGQTLSSIPVSTVAWSDFLTAHPGALVLSRDTGHDREYGRNPYVGYDEPDSNPFALRDKPDGRLPPKARVIGIGTGEHTAVVQTQLLVERRVLSTRLGDDRIVIFWKPGLNSALDSGQIAEGRDVGASGVFLAEIGGRALTFAAEGDQFRDRQTDSTWDIFGRALSGPLAGSELRPVPHVDTFWFAWAAYRPDAELLSG